MIRERKVQGAQFYITIPKEWRRLEGHNIVKGDTLDAHFESKSVLILNPQGREIDPIEQSLIDILIALPKLVGTTKLIENLKILVEKLAEV